MQSEGFVRGMLYLSLTVVGVPGNATVILAFLLALYQESRLLPADAIVLHLACANLLVVGVRCLLETLASFSQANIFGDTGCKAVIFVYRTSRSLSIWLTFVLSAYQCLSIAPPGSRWASFRTLAAHYLGFVFLLLWIINTCMSSAAILFSHGTQNDSSLMNHGINVQFCYVLFPSKLSKEANGAAQVGRDVVPMALMTLASLIILVFLYKHSQQAKGLRSNKSSSGGGGGRAERRAARAVVMLVTLYVVLYGVDNGLWVYTLTVRKTMSSSLISDLRIFFSSLYAALSPLVIIASNRKVNGRLRCGVQKKPIRDNEIK
ncbi:olfactory receptor class A related 2 [Diretmus argenteus]